MIGSLQQPYPLQGVSDGHMKKLCQVLWNWELCETCQNGQPCRGPKCPWRRSSRLEAFFGFYKEVTSSYVPELLFGSQPALRSHDDVCDIIRFLKSQQGATRSELTVQYFSRRAKDSELPPIADQHRAFNIAVKIMSMVTCSAENQPSGLLELGTQPLPWHDDTSFASFITRAFPRVDIGDLEIKDNSGKTTDVKSAITARGVKKIAALSFQGTDDLRNHLRLDARNGAVEIYHYTSVLKEHLMASQSQQGFVANIPNQICIEVLHSLQMILFPFDSDSEFILRGLVSNESSDPDCIHFDFAAYGEDNICYSYFGSRLMELYEEVKNPTPRGFVERWFERKSGARYAMMATLVGVLIAVILGMLSLAVGIFQAWVAYEAWKHPVVSGVES
ncbi:hypothetical protein DL766_001420 [Monosporascus sp. MC13-8B]|uniref:Uncharacterized protein n=1 Tax=Monosporascus cannonballus TaxID=155416 RepID=A0ABY0H7Y5_9PEZI|nr:hypothetical protein DL762_005975 [Monosporascus cannonballus]RYP37679.1 hypothetical protein DL766_001420 [Monosporascus sp. MC13-8B]